MHRWARGSVRAHTCARVCTQGSMHAHAVRATLMQARTLAFACTCVCVCARAPRCTPVSRPPASRRHQCWAHHRGPPRQNCCPPPASSAQSGRPAQGQRCMPASAGAHLLGPGVPGCHPCSRPARHTLAPGAWQLVCGGAPEGVPDRHAGGRHLCACTYDWAAPTRCSLTTLPMAALIRRPCSPCSFHGPPVGSRPPPTANAC